MVGCFVVRKVKGKRVGTSSGGAFNIEGKRSLIQCNPFFAEFQCCSARAHG